MGYRSRGFGACAPFCPLGAQDRLPCEDQFQERERILKAPPPVGGDASLSEKAEHHHHHVMIYVQRRVRTRAHAHMHCTSTDMRQNESACARAYVFVCVCRTCTWE